MSRKIFLILLIACSLIGCASRRGGVKSRDKARYYLQIGTSYLVNGKNQLALRNLLEARRLDHSNPVVRNNLGLAYFSIEKYDQAYVEFKAAIKIRSQFTDARNNLGGVLIAVGKYEQAIEELERASADLTYLKLDKVYNNLGLAHFRKGDFTKSMASFKKALEYQNKNCQSNYYFGRSAYGLKDFKTASESFDRAVGVCKESPDGTGAFFYSGLSRMKLGENDFAAGRFREVINLYPESTYAKKAKQLLEML